MKKIKITGKLSLNKETITQLSKNEMGQIIGGLTQLVTCPVGCYPTGSVAKCCQPTQYNTCGCSASVCC